jgi:hypothetical protein
MHGDAMPTREMRHAPVAFGEVGRNTPSTSTNEANFRVATIEHNGFCGNHLRRPL